MPGCPGRIQAMEWRTGGRGVGDLRSGRWWQDRGGGLGANRTVGEFAGAPVAGSGRDGGYSLVNVRRLGSGRPVGGGRDGRTPGRVRGAPAQGRMGQGGACSWMDGFVNWRCSFVHGRLKAGAPMAGRGPVCCALGVGGRRVAAETAALRVAGKGRERTWFWRGIGGFWPRCSAPPKAGSTPAGRDLPPQSRELAVVRWWTVSAVGGDRSSKAG